MDDADPWVRASRDGDRLIVAGGGAWTVQGVAALEDDLSALSADGAKEAVLDLSGLAALDTAGAWLVRKTIRSLGQRGVSTVLEGLSDVYAPLVRVVERSEERAEETIRPDSNYWLDCIERMGRAGADFLREGQALLNFYGLTVLSFVDLMRHPKKLRIVSLVNQVEQAGLNAIPIVCLLSFLIGIVIAFVGADQLRRFGAEIFTVNLLGVIMLREIGVLLASIMVAGRSGSAFTAQIGTMQINEEVDAIRTLGLDPMDVLVLPRINGLLISLPILAFLSSFAGLMGGALMASLVLDVTFTQFAVHLESVLTIEHFFVGMIKAPVFAYIIAIVGCYEGLRVTGGAESVGRMTTKSVVTSIFLVIIANAIFSVVFSALRI